MRDWHWDFEQADARCRDLERALSSQRAAVIEECARVAESWPYKEWLTPVTAAAAIRALKDKP